jgi:flagellar basal body L-ring protein FlgH
MAIKLKKMPKAPKLPKKPKASASLTAKANYLQRVKDQEKAYNAKCAGVNKENATRKSDAKKSETLTKQIAGVKRVTPKKK